MDMRTLLFASVTARIGFILIFIVSSFRSDARVAFRYWTASILGSTVGLLLIYADPDYPYFAADRGALIYLIIGLSLSCVWAGGRSFFARTVKLRPFIAMSIVPGLVYGAAHILGARPDIVVLLTLVPLICLTAIACQSMLVRRSADYLPSQLMVGVTLGAYSAILTLSFVMIVVRLLTIDAAPDRAATDIGMALFFEQFMSVLTYVGLIAMSLEDAQSKLKILATNDPLTSLANRRGIYEQTAILLKGCKRAAKPVTLMIVDIDHFKSINDRYGHENGDAVLREFARRLSLQVRPNLDVAGRWGGEEFLVVMCDTDVADAVLLAERLCRAVEEEPFSFGTQTVTVTVSIGVSTIEPHAPLDYAISRADASLYQAKATGRNRVCSDEERDGAALDRPKDRFQADCDGHSRPSTIVGPPGHQVTLSSLPSANLAH